MKGLQTACLYCRRLCAPTFHPTQWCVQIGACSLVCALLQVAIGNKDGESISHACVELEFYILVPITILVPSLHENPKEYRLEFPTQFSKFWLYSGLMHEMVKKRSWKLVCNNTLFCLSLHLFLRCNWCKTRYYADLVGGVTWHCPLTYPLCNPRMFSLIWKHGWWNKCWSIRQWIWRGSLGFGIFHPTDGQSIGRGTRSGLFGNAECFEKVNIRNANFFGVIPSRYSL